MATSSRFAVATHILTVLAVRGDEPSSSNLIASSVGTNPVVIRRLLGMLGRAGLVRAQGGRGGGALLVSSPASITLYDVYHAVEGRDLISLHSPVDTPCPVGRRIHGVLETCTAEAEEAMNRYLRGVTLAEIASRVEMTNQKPEARSQKPEVKAEGRRQKAEVKSETKAPTR
jgi:Rrf2 family protein